MIITLKKPPLLRLCVTAGGRAGHPVSEREAGAVQEAGGALGARSGEGKYLSNSHHAQLKV